MFDGISELVLPVRDVAPLQQLYVDVLGFRLTEQIDLADRAWQEIWGLPVVPSCILRLERPGSSGGGLVLVGAPDLSDPTPAGAPDRAGPYALDFYLRDAETVEARLAEADWSFRSAAVHYTLPGTDIPVRERMLEQPFSGLLHAMVQYRERGTRCALDQDVTGDVSEVVAAVFLTDRLEGALSFAREVLGGKLYFHGVFQGPQVENMLGLPPGQGLEAGLLRGPQSRNARLEFARPTGASAALRETDPVPRLIASWAVEDLDRLLPRLRDHGSCTGVITVGGERHIGFDSVYGARFDFVERTTA